MDERRLSTGDVLAMGILRRPVPITDVPEDRTTVRAMGDNGEFIGVPAVIAALEAGSLVSASNYYGCPDVWKCEDGTYRGNLLQYHVVTESPSFVTVEDAAEWFETTYHATNG